MAQFWPRTRWLTVQLLVFWLVMNVSVVLFAEDLQFTVLGYPFGFFMAAQGCTLVYVLIAWVYARRMRSIEKDR